MVRNTLARESKKRLQIMSAGEELFFRNGYRKVTVEDICRRAGASRMTFYKYFPNKMELFKAVWDLIIDDAYRHLDEVDLRTDLSFPEKMRLVIRNKMELLRRMSPELVEELLSSEPELGDFLREAQKRSMDQFLEFMKKAQERGDMRRVQPGFVLAIIGKMRELIEDESLVGLYADRLDFIEEMNSFFFFGITPHSAEEKR
ncbi:MAG TPA: TetR/AcrR family transcriptional regulator [Candidatus Krumholzibacterium sp.]|nr:TetR/AcrR family transcriptional regulator [Candidatus Krumholzibacterium sp.]